MNADRAWFEKMRKDEFEECLYHCPVDVRHGQHRGACCEEFAARSAAAAADDQRDRLIVYYFHGKIRCPTCRNIEDYAHEAVIKGFSAEVSDGRIEWKVVDFEEPANQCFAKDFELGVPSVVLVEMRDGVRKRWKNLYEVWELVDDKPTFVAFIHKEVQAFLNEK